MTEHTEFVTSSNHDQDAPEGDTATPDLQHPTAAEMADAVAATEEMNEADEVYATEMADAESPADEETVASETPAVEATADETGETETPADETPAEAPAQAPTAEAPTAEAPSESAPESAATLNAEAVASVAILEAPEDLENTQDPAAAGPATTETVSEAPATPAPAPAGRPGGPRPMPGGPRRPTPIPRPVGASAVTVVVPVVGPDLSEASDPTPWGRVDPNGTVYVTTADGEREVGFWQAGDPAAGLAHYGRRYDDFMTEVVLLESRLANHAGDPKAARTHAQMLRQSIDTLPAVGDLTSAATRLDAVITAADEAVSDNAKERANSKAVAVGRREALCVEAEELAESSQWKASGDRLKEIVEEWRTIRGIDRKTDDLLWKRFSKARDTFIRRRGSHFAEMDKERGAAKGSKEKLIARAEELADSTDWAATATEYRNLMTEWKAAGRTSREVEDALWDRFRNAQEKFFSHRQETFASRDAEFDTNAEVKEALLVEAEKINPANGLDAAKAALRSIQDRWEAAGKVPRERIRTLDGRLRAVEDKIKSAEDSLWRKTDPETTARLAQFRSRYETYQAQADKATAAGDTKRAAGAQAQADQWLEWLQAAENAVE